MTDYNLMALNNLRRRQQNLTTRKNFPQEFISQENQFPQENQLPIDPWQNYFNTPTDPKGTPVNPTVDNTQQNLRDSLTPQTRGGVGGARGGIVAPGTTGTSFNDLWQTWLGGTNQQMLNPEGLGNLDQLYGQTLDFYGNQFKAGWNVLGERMTSAGLGSSNLGKYMQMNWTMGQASAAGAGMRDVYLKDVVERIRQKDLAYSNTLQAYGINQQLKGQQAIARSNVSAAAISAEPAMMNAFTNAIETYSKYGINPMGGG